MTGMFSDFVKELVSRRIIKIEEDGIKLFGDITYAAIPTRPYAIFFQEVGMAAGGGEKGKKYLFQLGYEAGADAAKEMQVKMRLSDDAIAKRLKRITSFSEIIGFGKLDFVIYDVKKGKIMMRIAKHPVIEQGKKLFGKDSMVCSYYRGVYSAHVAKQLKIPKAELEETQCICKGQPYCEWSYGVFKNKS